MNSTKHNRESGYYWVKFSEPGDWWIAEFDGHKWKTPGRTLFHDASLFEINETRILNPDEKPSEKIIYGVSEWREYEGGGVIAIFSTRELADKYLKKLNRRKKEKSLSFEIEEMGIDGEREQQ